MSRYIAWFDDVVFKSTVRVHTAMEIQIVNIECHIVYRTIRMIGLNSFGEGHPMMIVHLAFI